MKILLIMSLLFLTSANALSKQEPYRSCLDQQIKQAKRSAELQEIEAADQADREGNVLKPGASFRDRIRRQRVGEIFGEGCFKTAKDYAAAALVFQHGDHPDHYWQTFTWAKKAFELGDQSQEHMMAFGLDRFLVNTGKKQLFASQAQKPNGEECWCLTQTEVTFPEKLRQEYINRTLTQQYEWIDALNAGTSCLKARQCTQPLEDTPRGSVPGFW